MFKTLKLGNFKRFQKADINFKKINIVVGPNNSGKSSIIAALRLICQTLDSYDDQVSLLLNGPFGDFGTFKDLIYRNHRGRPLDIFFEIETKDLFPEDSKASTIAIAITYKYNQEDREVFAQNVSIWLNSEHLISLQYTREGRRHLVEQIGQTTIPSTLKNTISREFRIRHFFPVPITSRLGIFYGRDGKTAYHEFIDKLNASPAGEVPRKLLRVWQKLSSAITRTDYLGPLRTAPARTYLYTGERSKRIGSSGENFTSVLATRDRKRDREREGRSSSINDRIDNWLQRAEMAKKASLASISDRHFEIRIQNFFTSEDQNIADVGFGHSQVLPFLAGGYALGPHSVYFAEQPELHLHPKAQAELGNYLLDLYQQSTQTIVETHSEHLILRLQQHVAAGLIQPQDIRIFYVCNMPPDSTDHPIKEITIIDLDEKGQFTKTWPKGFFPEKLEESKKLAQIRMEKTNFKG